MAGYGITHFFPGGTKEQYEKTLTLVHPDGGTSLPAGQTYHAAGPTGDGWLVVAMWDSKDVFESFRDGTLGPALHDADGVLPGPPVETSFEVDHESTA